MTGVSQHDFPTEHMLETSSGQRLSPQVWAEVAGSARGIFSDVDDTLTHDGALVPEAYAAICRARDAGLRIVLVTGRPIGWAEVLASIFPVDAAIAENGAVAAVPSGSGKRTTARFYFDDEPARVAGRALRTSALELAQREVPEAQLTVDHPLREVDLAFDIAERATLPEPAIDRLASVFSRVGLRTARSSIHLHGTYSLGDKARMSARVAAHLWGESQEQLRERYLYVGDSPNDAPAFSFFPRSVGVRNVLESRERLRALGAMPWAITRAHGGHGFAELVRALLAERR